MYRKAVFVASAALSTLLLGVVPAQAGTSFQIGVGRSPEVVVDDSGLARVAWSNNVEPGNDSVTYCTVPRGATACASKVDLSPPSDGTGTSDVAILRDGSNITLLAETESGVYANTFPAASTPANSWTKVADISFATPSAILGPTPGPGSIMITSGSRTQTFPKTGPEPADFVEHNTSFFAPTSGGIALEPGTNRPVRFSSDGDNINSHRYMSNDFTVGALNTAANWSAPVVEEGSGSVPELAAGPRGLFMFNNATIGSGRSQFKIRRFNGTRFGPPTDAAPEETGYEYDLFQQPTTGTLTAVWRQNAPAGTDGDRIRLIRSTDGGVTWSTPGDVVRQSPSANGLIRRLRLGIAPDDQGFAVYEGEGTGGDGATKAPIRLTTLDVLPPEMGPTPGPGTDTTNPTITNPSIGDSTLFPGQGTTFSFISSEGGSAKLVFQKQGKGLKLKKGRKLKCFTSSKRQLRKLRKLLAKTVAVKSLKGKARRRKLAQLVKKRGCKPFKTIGSITQVVTPGRNEIVFTGRVAGRKLAPGVYRATLTVRDLAGNLSSGRVFKFRVVKPRRR